MLQKTWLVVAFLVGGLTPAWSAETAASSEIRLTLPPTGYAVAGAPMSVYFDNIVLTEQPEELKFVVTSDFGTTEKGRWTVTPTEAQIGTHKWQVEVFKGDQPLAKGEMTWHVSPAKAKSPRDVSLLIVGDSLTHATIYPNELAKRLTDSGLSKWTMLGTHRPSSAAPGVAHEGYGGWTWERFIKHYEPMPDPAKRKHSSPFVFLEGDKPKLDVPRFIHEACHDRAPDYVIFMLGINDCFGANPNDLAKTDQHIDGVFKHAETLIKAFREAAPKAQLGICLTTPGNARESGFTANYKGKYPRWGWKRIQHRLVERELKQFGGEQSRQNHISLIPTELNLDPVDGYPVDNGVHPNAVGYHQIAATMHAWLMAQLTASE